MVGMGRQKLSELHARSRVDLLRRGHCRYGPSFAPDWVPHGALRPLLPSSGMDHRQQRFLIHEPDSDPPRNRPDPRVDRLASHSGPPNEDRHASRDHIRRDDLTANPAPAQTSMPRPTTRNAAGAGPGARSAFGMTVNFPATARRPSNGLRGEPSSLGLQAARTDLSDGSGAMLSQTPCRSTRVG